MFKVKSIQPLKMPNLAGKEGQAVINYDSNGLRQDNIYLPNEVKLVSDVFNMPTRDGWDKAI